MKRGTEQVYEDAEGRRHRLGYSISPYPKSPAGNRKLYLSKGARKYYNMIASKQLTNEEIRKFAGHEDFATTERYYEFATKSMEERTEAFEAALG